MKEQFSQLADEKQAAADRNRAERSEGALSSSSRRFCRSRESFSPNRSRSSKRRIPRLKVSDTACSMLPCRGALKRSSLDNVNGTAL